MSIFEERESSIRAYSRMFPVVFSSAKNARQTDENGKEYIDFRVTSRGDRSCQKCSDDGLIKITNLDNNWLQ